MDLTVLHVALELTANSKPQFYPSLPAVSGESSMTACQVEELATKTTEGAALEVKECIDCSCIVTPDLCSVVGQRPTFGTACANR